MSKKYLGTHNFNAFVSADSKRYVSILAKVREDGEFVTKTLTIETPKDIMDKIMELSKEIALLAGYDSKGIIQVKVEEGE